MYARDSWTRRRSTSSGGRCPRPAGVRSGRIQGSGSAHGRSNSNGPCASRTTGRTDCSCWSEGGEPGQLGEGLGCPRAARSDARRPSRRPPVARGHTLDARHEVPRWGQPQSAPPMTPSLCRLRRGKGRLDRQEAVVGHPVLVLLRRWYQRGRWHTSPSCRTRRRPCGTAGCCSPARCRSHQGMAGADARAAVGLARAAIEAAAMMGRPSRRPYRYFACSFSSAGHSATTFPPTSPIPSRWADWTPRSARTTCPRRRQDDPGRPVDGQDTAPAVLLNG